MSPDDPLSEMVVYKPVPSSMRSDQAIEMIQGWLGTCNFSHKDCPKNEAGYLPTRVIDVGNPDGTEEPYLFVPGHPNSRHVDPNHRQGYIALSYCWGSREELAKKPPLLTTPSSLGGHMSSIPLGSLPATIADAVIITRQQGIRYLWVDSLCILQGETTAAREDWAIESTKMASVYGGALLTISAAWGRSVHDGIFTNRKDSNSDGINLRINCSQDPSRSGAVRLIKPLEPFIDSL